MRRADLAVARYRRQASGAERQRGAATQHRAGRRRRGDRLSARRALGFAATPSLLGHPPVPAAGWCPERPWTPEPVTRPGRRRPAGALAGFPGDGSGPGVQFALTRFPAPRGPAPARQWPASWVSTAVSCSRSRARDSVAQVAERDLVVVRDREVGVGHGSSLLLVASSTTGNSDSPSSGTPSI